jgi:glycosyltransferase involved in cell wall biosynthesis
MVEHWEHVTGEIVMYLDADTQIVSPLNFAELFELSSASSSNGVTPVFHPGYFKRSRLRNAIIRTRLGPWENRKHSTAYVPFRSRRNYVCGGVIWGLRELFLQMCVNIKANINLDLEHNIVAKHNDESHLNHWFVSHPTLAATPEWAYASGYKNLACLMPRIEVIHKPATFNRIPTKLD